MRLLELGVLYAFVGAGCVAALMRNGRRRGNVLDAALLLLLWPLYAPLLFRQGEARDRPPDAAFLDALERTRGTPLGALLPDANTARLLSERLAAARRRIDEIDLLLGDPAFDEDAARRRRDELQALGDTVSSSLAGTRLTSIRRLRSLRERFARELVEVGELVSQLRVQAELVRLAGTSASGTSELVTLLVARVDGLGAALDECGSPSFPDLPGG
jgi:hypothetical protein